MSDHSDRQNARIRGLHVELDTLGSRIEQLESALAKANRALGISQDALTSLVTACEDSASCGCAFAHCTCGFEDAVIAGKEAIGR